MDIKTLTTSFSERRIRASKPKVKSGCITCKIRRVKCDETKPSCLRCQKFGRECDGYAVSKPTRRPVVPIVPILPRPASHSSYSLLQNEQNDRNDYYFQIYCDKTASDLSTFFSTEFWTGVVPQESRTCSSIRHAVLALGGLTASVLQRRHPPPNPIDHHQYALEQYNLAIIDLRQTLEQGMEELRTALVACILFICFENLHGDHAAATAHTQAGQALLDQWHDQSPRDPRLDVLLQDDVFNIFTRMRVSSSPPLTPPLLCTYSASLSSNAASLSSYTPSPSPSPSTHSPHP